jgi:hypothetical protein
LRDVGLVEFGDLFGRVVHVDSFSE